MRRILCLMGWELLLLACSPIESQPEPGKGDDAEYILKASIESSETKTERQGDDGSGNYPVYWCPGDVVSLFFNQGDHGGNRFVNQNTVITAKAEFKGTITGFAGSGESTGGQFWFWGAYPYSEDNSCDGSSITLTLPAQQTAKLGSFDNGLWPTMARSKGLDLSFYNICGGMVFSVSRDDIKTVVFSGNANEDIAGKARIGWSSDEDNAYPVLLEHLDGKKEITVTAPGGGTFLPGRNNQYYIVMFPELLSQGFTVSFITTDSKKGEYSYTAKSQQISRGRFKNGYINNHTLDELVTEWTDYEDSSEQGATLEGGTESGLYLGMSTFERYLTYYPAHLISEETLESYNDIVDNLELTTLNGTSLYYSIDEDITSMQSITLPDDLFNVSIVTFTDGLDEGSLSYRRNVYKTKAEYLEALHTRLTNELVSDLPIKSYAIGLKGTDAQSNLSEFRNNLEKIASTPENTNEKYVYEISSINELNSSFESIADQLSQNIRVQKVIVSIPYPEDGERKRFTLDNKAPNQSTKYIEGVVDLDNLQLTNVVYYGLTSTSGSVVPISADYWFELEFTFEGIQTLDGTEIVQDNIQLWYIPASGSSWQRNTEFSPSENSNVSTEQKSALVLLNLDLSKSLEGQLPTLKSGAKSFLSRLYNASVDPDVIKKVRLNKTEVDIKVGQSEVLQASVSPSTASVNQLRWSSTIPNVAAVDQSGRVTGVSEGTTIISISTEDGKELATCTTRVTFQHLQSISLNYAELNMCIGKTSTLIVTSIPEDASNPTVTWTSSNPDVASINGSGVVTAHSTGTTNIVATSIDGAKTASCTITVTDYTLSDEPLDLSLAVWYQPETGDAYKGYIPYEDLDYVNSSDYEIIGLTILGDSENMIMALEDASTEPMTHKASDLYNMPSRTQGIIISARLNEINQALLQFGGESLKFGGRGLWTKDGNSSGYFYFIGGSGGDLFTASSGGLYYVREVLPIDNASLNCFITKSEGIYYSYLNNSQRFIVDSPTQVPAGCSVDGISICCSKGIGNVIISLIDASSSAMTWTAACSSFGKDNLPSRQQALLISARLKEVNDAMSNCGGNQIDSKGYWTSDYYNYTNYYFLPGGGCEIGSCSDGGYKHVRLIKGTF